MLVNQLFALAYYLSPGSLFSILFFGFCTPTMRGYLENYGTREGSCITKTHSSMGDRSQRLQLWSSLEDLQAARQVGNSLPGASAAFSLFSSPNCLYNLEEEKKPCTSGHFQGLPET